MHQDKNMEFNSQLVGNGANIHCHISTLKPHFTYQDQNIASVICGDVFLNEQVTTVQEIAETFINQQRQIERLYSQLSGQFWLILIDKTNDELIVMSDHFGIQPCFYTLQNQVLHISDSLKRLKNIDGLKFTIAEQALFNYMYFHCIPSPNTIFEQVAKLEPGKAVIFDGDMQAKEQLLYQPKFAENNLQTLEKNQQALFQTSLDTIDHAVAKHETESCGAFLSGGLDSSSVAGMLARHQTPAKTFSIGFNEKAYDETAYALITSKHFDTQHEVLYLQPEQAAEEFVKVAQYFDEPFGNSSAMATYFCAKFAKSHGVDRLLAGDGGDELFAGNERYAKQKRFEVYQQVPTIMQQVAKGVFCKTPLGKLPLLSKGASYIQQAEVPLPDRLESYNFLNRLGIENIFEEEFLTTVNTLQPIQQQRQRYEECSSKHSVDQMLYLDWKFTLADNDLVKVGRMCDMAGIEVRYPLLDKLVVDFSCTLPADVKLPGNKLRHFYKESCRGFLADETLTKSKHGFGLPFGVWMKENKVLQEIVLDNLLAFKKRKIVKDSLVDSVLDAHQSVHASYYGELIWIMVVLELWLQQ